MDCLVQASGTQIVTLDCIAPLVGNLLLWAITLAGVVALFFVIFGGFKFLTSGGEKEKVEGARKTITFAIIGLVVIFSSFAILRLVGQITGIACLSTPFDSGGKGWSVNSCGLPRDTGGALQCNNVPPDCGLQNTVCNNNTGQWECAGGK